MKTKSIKIGHAKKRGGHKRAGSVINCDAIYNAEQTSTDMDLDWSDPGTLEQRISTGWPEAIVGTIRNRNTNEMQALVQWSPSMLPAKVVHRHLERAGTSLHLGGYRVRSTELISHNTNYMYVKWYASPCSIQEVVDSDAWQKYAQQHRIQL